MSDVKRMRVAKIMDKTTLVIAAEAGGDLSGLRDGARLLILASAGTLENGAPLFIPKASVEVTHNAGSYVIARSTTYVREEPAFSLSSVNQTVKVRLRNQLDVDETQVTGNPASAAITVGDPVIRDGDLERYVRSFLQTSEKTSTEP